MARVVLFSFFLLLPLFALDLDARLAAIEKLPAKERYKAMNELKKELMRLNEKRRQELLRKLLKKYRVVPDSQIHTPSLP